MGGFVVSLTTSVMGLYSRSTAEVPSFVERIVSELGTPKEPFGTEELVGLGIILAVVLLWIAFEGGIAAFFMWVFKRVRLIFETTKNDPEVD